jgi:hypothetical protein
MTAEELASHMHGRPNADVLSYLAGYSPRSLGSLHPDENPDSAEVLRLLKRHCPTVR